MKHRVMVGAFALALASCGVSSAAVRLYESGSSLFFPLMATWANAYGKLDRTVAIFTESSGSGAGIAAAIAGKVQIGASDAYLSDGQVKDGQVVNIPLVVSAQFVGYHLPEIGRSQLNLSGPVLAGIYSGTIRYWNDARIAAINPELATKLPHQLVIPVRRTESSGDTFLFTNFLSATSPEWKSGPGAGSAIVWPRVDRQVSALRNRGIVEALQVSPYAVGYVGISYLNQATALGIGHAALQNKSGKFVLPTEDAMRAAVQASASTVPADLRLSMIDAPGEAAYPIVNFEYAIVRPHQASAELAAQVRKFLLWSVEPDGGSAPDFLSPVHFLALPPTVVERSKQQIAEIR
jgi:phosphate transport system substrate-binding protein